MPTQIVATLQELLACEKLHEQSGNIMKAKQNKTIDDLRPEYDFSQLEGKCKGKYVKSYKKCTNVVLLDPDVAKVFHDEGAVNEALRTLMRVTYPQTH